MEGEGRKMLIEDKARRVMTVCIIVPIFFRQFSY